MQTVTFAKPYKHKIDDLRTAHYPAGAELEVNEEIAKAARKAGALKEETNGRGHAKGDGEGSDNGAEK